MAGMPNAIYHLEFESGNQWVKTPRGWVLQELDNFPAPGPNVELVNARPELRQSNKEVSHGRNIHVSGMKGQRHVSVCLSEFVDYFDLLQAACDIRRKAYLLELMSKIMEKYILSVSGTAHTKLFKVLEAMFNEALQSEYMVKQIQRLLVQSLVTLQSKGPNMIGSKRLWNRHIQTVSNMCTKMEQFKFKERGDDDQLTVLDLPKECLLDIIQRLSDHKDILHLGATCWYFNDLVQDPFVWEKLTQYHFSEKQMMTFVGDDLGEYSAWRNLYKNCFKKYGFRGTRMFTDKAVICSACKTLHWLMIGHNCWSNKESTERVYLEPVGTIELISMLNY